MSNSTRELPAESYVPCPNNEDHEMVLRDICQVCGYDDRDCSTFITSTER